MAKSQKSKKSGSGQGINGGGKGRSSKRRQKQLHSGDQRALKKLKVASSSSVEQKTRESYARKLQLKRKLQYSQIARLQQREEERLRHWNALDRHPAPKPKNKEYVLKGAARPAWQVYPELYPEVHAEIAERNKRIETDLFEEQKGKFSQSVETRGYLSALCQEALLRKIDGKTSGTLSSLNKCLALDEADALGAKVGLISAHLDSGDVDAAAKLLDDEITWWITNNQQIVPAEFLYAKVVVEYITKVLMADEQDETSSDQDKNPLDEYVEKADRECRMALEAAIKANPFIAEVLVKSEAFELVTNPNDVDEVISEHRSALLNKFSDFDQDISTQTLTPKYRGLCLCDAGATPNGSPEQAVAYFVQEISCWRDVDGLLDWVGYVFEDMLDQEQTSLCEENERATSDVAKTLFAMYEKGTEQWMADALGDSENESVVED